MDNRDDGKLRDRRVRPNGSRIIDLRKKKNWTFEDLMTNARCSRVTLDKVEDNQMVYPCTIRKIANALGEEQETLVAGYIPPSEVDRKQDRFFDVQIKLSVPFEGFDECSQLRQLLQALELMVLAARPLNPKEVLPSSVVIILEMNAHDIDNLALAFRQFVVYGFVRVMAMWIDGWSDSAGWPILAKHIIKENKHNKFADLNFSLINHITEIRLPDDAVFPEWYRGKTFYYDQNIETREVSSCIR